MKKIFYVIAIALMFTSTTATATVYTSAWPGPDSTEAEFSCDNNTPLPAMLSGICINLDDNSQIQIESRVVTQSGYTWWVPTKAGSNYEITIYVEQSNGGVEVASHVFETPPAITLDITDPTAGEDVTISQVPGEGVIGIQFHGRDFTEADDKAVIVNMSGTIEQEVPLTDESQLVSINSSGVKVVAVVRTSTGEVLESKLVVVP